MEIFSYAVEIATTVANYWAGFPGLLVHFSCDIKVTKRVLYVIGFFDRSFDEGHVVFFKVIF